MQEGLEKLPEQEPEDLLSQRACAWRGTGGVVKHEPNMFLPRTSWLSLPSSPKMLFLPIAADRWTKPAPIATPTIFQPNVQPEASFQSAVKKAE
jgi:hypothetical protein